MNDQLKDAKVKLTESENEIDILKKKLTASYLMQPITFRKSSVDLDYKWSDAEQIGVGSSDWNKIHVEITSRPLQDGETFSVTGDKYQVGAGLSVDSTDMNNIGIRWKHNCVGFYGDGKVMPASDENNKENLVPMDRPTAKPQGFIYDATNNCLIHVGSANKTPTPLLAHFARKYVRAFVQV